MECLKAGPRLSPRGLPTFLTSGPLVFWSQVPDRVFAVGVAVSAGGSQGLVPVPVRGPREPDGRARLVAGDRRGLAAGQPHGELVGLRQPLFDGGEIQVW